MIRPVWFLCGSAALIVGTIGMFLPLVPTVPLVLLAAFCFARGSQRVHDWLLAHPVFGPPIRDWRDRGAIHRRGKWVASTSILLAFLLALIFGVPLKILVIQVAALGGVALFIWTRPEA